MWSVFKLSMRHGRKVLQISEIVLSSFFLGHNLKNYFSKPVAKVLKKHSSEELFTLMKSRIVNIYEGKREFIGNGVVLDDIVFMNMPNLESESFKEFKNKKLSYRHIQNGNEQIKALDMLYLGEDDSIAVFKIDKTNKDEALELENRDIKEGEKLLVYSPLTDDQYVLQDCYLLRKNILNSAFGTPVHKINVKNEDSQHPDIAFDYYGGFQGFIPPQTDVLVESAVSSQLYKRHKAGLKFEKRPLGLVLVEELNDNDHRTIIIKEIEAGSLAAETGVQIGDAILAINGHKIRKFEDVSKVVGYSLSEELIIKAIRNGQVIDIKVSSK